MKVLVLGGGGREHALVWKLRQSPRISKLYCAPGSGGIAEDAECVSIISHLVGCATCLHLTADLIRFEPDMNEVSSTSISEQDPGPMRQFLDRIADTTQDDEIDHLKMYTEGIQ